MNRARLLVTVLGGLSLLFSLFFLVMNLWRRDLFPTAAGWRVCFAYAGGAGLLFLVRFLLGWERTRKPAQGLRSPARIDPGKSGMILLLALVMLGAITALVLYLQQAAYVARQADLRQLERTQLRIALLDEGFARLQELADDPHLEVDSLEKEWLMPREVERADGIVTMSRIRDLNRYVDINNLHLPDTFAGPNLAESILAEAMTYAGDFTPLERLVAVSDWMDPDDSGIRGSAFYRQKDPGYEVPGTWLHSWSELKWMEGFEPAYFEPQPLYRVGRAFEADISALLTVIPGPRERPIPININTAAFELLEAVAGSEQAVIARFVQMARSERPIRSLEVLQPYIEDGALQLLRPFLGVRSTHFVLDLMAVHNRHRLQARVVAERTEDGQTHILQWVMN